MSQTIGSYLRNLRGARGMTQHMAALSMGVQRATVCRWETDTQIISGPMLSRLLSTYKADDEQRATAYQLADKVWR